MLMGAKEFMDVLEPTGCTRSDYFRCADQLTRRPEQINYYKSLGQFIYYRLDRLSNILVIVANTEENARQSPDPYTEVFQLLKQISH